jgi:hypothetical protein
VADGGNLAAVTGQTDNQAADLSAAAGIASSFIFTRPYKGFVVTPLADNGFYGIAISRQW